MATSKVQDTLRRIQEEAKQKVAAARYARSKPPLPVAHIEVAPTADEVVASLREQITTAVAKALSTKAARQYVSDVTDQLQQLASDAISQARTRQDFGGTAQDGEGNIVIYPNNCKLFVQGNDGRCSLIIEEPPQYRTVFAYSGSKQVTYRIAMPYMVFVVGFHHTGRAYTNQSVGVGFGKEPITSVDQRLLNPKLPHTQGNTHVCQPMNKYHHNSVKEIGEYVVQTFWSTVFHYTFRDANCTFELENGQRIESFADWEKKVKNPLDILKAPFSRGNSVRELLAQFGAVETRQRNTPMNDIQAAVGKVVNGINLSLSADELSDVIRQTAEEIVNVALQNAVGNSALQHSK